MFAIRRGPAAAARALRLASVRLGPVSKAGPVHALSRSASRPIAARSLHLTAARLQHAASYTQEQLDDVDQSDGYGPSAGHGGQAGEPVTFQDLADQRLVDPVLIDRITKDMRLSTMTDVQRLTVAETIQGKDLIAQAKTGTGKTLAFLLPVLQNIVQKNPELRRPRTRGMRAPTPSDIRAIIISPTRELAEQIATEARKVVRGTGIMVHAAVGGTEKRKMLYQMVREGCHLLVATPGRLKDLLSDRNSGVAAPQLNTFVLDEADRLLDDGFWPEIRSIMDMLPPRERVDRQTLMYSATVPEEVVNLVEQTMKPDFQFVRTVADGELPTHERVPQKIVTLAGFENALPTLLELCQREIAAAPPSQPFKAIVYSGSTADVKLAATAFRSLRSGQGGLFARHPLHPAKIVEMHSRLSQAQRTTAAGIFRGAESAIMFSSDVTSRGMDFPNVTHVIQVGMPGGHDTYVHRLGRTARGDKDGQGWLLVTADELRVTRSRIKGLPLQPDRSLAAAEAKMDRQGQLPASVVDVVNQVRDAMRYVPREVKVAAYLAQLGVYQYLDSHALARSLKTLSTVCWGLDKPPSVPPATAKRMNLFGVPDIEIGSHDRESPYGDRGSGPGGFGGGRRDSFGGGRGGDMGGRGYGGGRGGGDMGGGRGYGRDWDSRGRGGGGGGSFGGGGGFGGGGRGRGGFDRDRDFGGSRGGRAGGGDSYGRQYGLD